MEFKCDVEKDANLMLNWKTLEATLPATSFSRCVNLNQRHTLEMILNGLSELGALCSVTLQEAPGDVVFSFHELGKVAHSR